MRTQRPFAHDTAQDGHGVLPHLHHREIVAWLLLHAQHPVRARVAFVGHLAQTQAAGGRERNLGHGEKGAGCNQQPDHEEALGQGHGTGGEPVHGVCATGHQVYLRTLCAGLLMLPGWVVPTPRQAFAWRGGAGGTNFVAIEAARSCQAINTEMLSWGIPTAASAFEVATSLPENIDLIISGGIRTPLDCVKGLTIGAKAAAIAAPALRLLTDHETVEQAAEEFHRMLLQIRRYMMLVGASQVGELPSVPIVISGFTREWLIARGIDTTKYAQR